MPSQVLWVYECPRFAECWEKMTTTQPLAKFSEPIRALLERDPPHVLLPLWKKHKEALLTLITELPVTISAHRVDEQGIGFMLYVPFTSVKWSLFQKFLEHLPNTKHTAYSYQGTSLYTWTIDSMSLTYGFIDGYFTLSTHARLIEEVLQTEQSSSFAPFASSLTNHTYLGRSYVNPQSWKIFTPYTSILSNIASHSILELHAVDPYVSLSGFMAQPVASQQIFTQSFGDQAPEILPYLYLVPNTCAAIKTYAFHEAKAWNLSMQNYWISQNVSPLEKRLSLFSQNIDIESLFDYVGQLASCLYLSQSTHIERLFLLHLRDPKAMHDALQSIDDQLHGTWYAQRYKERTIYYLGLENLPYLLFGEEFNDFSALYYTYQGSFLLGSSSLESLETALDLIDEEKTWGRTPHMSHQLTEGLPTANFSLHINLHVQWHVLGSAFPENYASFFSTYTPSLTPSVLSLQLRFFEEKPYIQLRSALPTLQNRKSRAKSVDLSHRSHPTTLTDYEIVEQSSFEQDILGGPKVVYMPQRLDFQVFIEEEGRIHALGKHAKPIWSLDIKGVGVSKWFVIDYYRNQGVQYAFATTEAIYIVDSRGQLLRGFPLQLPDQAKIATLNVIDYDGSKRYRFFVSDEEGKVYVMDKSGQALPGWNPKVVEPLIVPPFHMRVGNRDIMILLSGTLHMYKRIGRSYPGFPFTTHAPLVGGWIKKSTQFEHTYFMLLTDQGEYIAYTLNGKEKIREVLDPSIREATYQIVESVTGKSCVFVIIEKEKIVVLGESREKWFEINNFLQSQTCEVKYYDLGEGQDVLVFFDQAAQKAYFYDLEGREQLPSIETTGPISLVYSSYRKTYSLYVAHKQKYMLLKYIK